MSEEWDENIIQFIELIRAKSVSLSQKHTISFFSYKKIMNLFDIPIIILSVFSSFISVGISNFVSQPNISITTALASYSAANPNSVDVTFNGLSSYPLSAYQNNWNWGLPTDVNWNSITQQYSFYLQTPTVVSDINKIDGYIDWSNNLTTLTAIQFDSNLSTYFTMSGGLMEQYLGNALRRGVGLI
jgi:hypothetical protein